MKMSKPGTARTVIAFPTPRLLVQLSLVCCNPLACAPRDMQDVEHQEGQPQGDAGQHQRLGEHRFRPQLAIQPLPEQQGPQGEHDRQAAGREANAACPADGRQSQPGALRELQPRHLGYRARRRLLGVLPWLTSPVVLQRRRILAQARIGRQPLAFPHPEWHRRCALSQLITSTKVLDFSAPYARLSIISMLRPALSGSRRFTRWLPGGGWDRPPPVVCGRAERWGSAPAGAFCM
jgi:hypothetical protein